MSSENDSKDISLINKTLFFTSIKEKAFDYSLPIKTGLAKFCASPRAEASPSLFEYLCYKIVEKNAKENKINKEVAIISEKFLSSKNCKINIIKTKSIKKKFILIPIRNEISRKWNAVIFVHLEKQIMQYMNQMNEEPIIAKIISSNINSEEDDFILNTTMDRIETAFNFSSPEDIQFEVDSINISDQPNTSVFLLNFIEGLINQENNENIMNFIMKLYDENCNSNAIGSNNYFISFNKENIVFNNLIEEYQNELNEYLKIKDKKEENKNENKIEKNVGGNDDDIIDSEEEALKIIAKENEEIRKRMEEQELYFPNNNKENMLGLIQEVENESDDDSEKKSNINNKSLKISKSLKKVEDSTNYDFIKNNNAIRNIKLFESDNENTNINQNNMLENNNNEITQLNKEESIELNNDFQNNNNNEMIKPIDENLNINNKEPKIGDIENLTIKNKNNNLNEEGNNLNINNTEINKKKEDKENININIDLIRENEEKAKIINDKNKDEMNNLKINNKNTIQNKTRNSFSINNSENNSIDKIIICNSVNKTIDATNSILHKNKSIFSDNSIRNSVRDSCNSSNSSNSIYERKKLPKYHNKNKSFNISNRNSEHNINNSDCSNICISKNISHKVDNAPINNNNLKVNIDNNNKNSKISNIINKSNDINNNININQNTYINSNLINKKEEDHSDEVSKNIEDEEIKINEKINNLHNDYKNNNLKKGKCKNNLPLVKRNIINQSSINENNNTNINNNSINNINNNINNNQNNNINNNLNKNKINNNNNNNNDFKNYKKNTIIINDPSNNSTVINFIEIKNNYEANNSNDSIEENKPENKEKNKIITKKNQIWNINISSNNNYNLINNLKEENDCITHIPDDGTVNRISTTLSPHKSITGIINNKENILKIETEEDKESMSDRLKGEKNNLVLDSNNNGNKDDENKIDVNVFLNSNRSIIQRRMTKKKRLKGEKGKNKNGNIGLIKEYEPDDCALNLSKDLKCGCAGNIENACYIF